MPALDHFSSAQTGHPQGDAPTDLFSMPNLCRLSELIDWQFQNQLTESLDMRIDRPYTSVILRLSLQMENS
jgi:hypothetical protein